MPPPPQFIVGHDAYGRPARFEAIHYSPKDRGLAIDCASSQRFAGSGGCRVAPQKSCRLSFGVLLLLGATMGLIIVAGARAHRLAALQMDFVASVSHELRTPVAAISVWVLGGQHGRWTRSRTRSKSRVME